MQRMNTNLVQDMDETSFNIQKFNAMTLSPLATHIDSRSAVACNYNRETWSGKLLLLDIHEVRTSVVRIACIITLHHSAGLLEN